MTTRQTLKYSLHDNTLMTSFLTDYQQHLVVRLEQGMLEITDDWTGFQDSDASKSLQRFYHVNDSYERMLRNRELLDSPFQLDIILSKDTYIVHNFKTFTLADLLIALGGISRSFYILGMLCATAVSKVLFKRALIRDLFMWQKPDKKKQAEEEEKMRASLINSISSSQNLAGR